MTRTTMRKLKVNETYQNWYDNGGIDKIGKYFADPDGIMTTSAGLKAGVYAAYVLLPDGREFLMYIGEVGRDGRGFRDRLVEHAKHWTEYPEHYTGVKFAELMEGYKYVFRIVKEEKDHEKRYALEQEMIEKENPFLQSGCYPKYVSKDNRFDMCLANRYRRRAFITARDGCYVEEKYVLTEQIYKVAVKTDLNTFKTVAPKAEIVKVIEQEMPCGSALHYDVKGFVEEKMGIDSKRGCKYSYLVKVVAAALEDVYNKMSA